MSEQSFSQALVVGNYCHDTLVNHEGTFECLGGSAAYISAVFQSLRVPYRLVAKAGLDFKYFNQVHFPPIIGMSKPTTHFVDDYTHGERQALLKSKSEVIQAADLGDAAAGIGLACGVADELTPEALLRLRELCDVLICDAQGLIRTTEEGQPVHHRPIAETPFAPLLGEIDFLKASVAEYPFIDPKLIGPSTCLILTEGPRGCRLIRNGKSQSIPSFEVKEVDSTGAGDCFLAGFAHGLMRGMSPEGAARHGNFFGSLAVQQVGIPDFAAITARMGETPKTGRAAPV